MLKSELEEMSYMHNHVLDADWGYAGASPQSGQHHVMEMLAKCRFNAACTFLGFDRNFHENQTCINRA